MGRFLGERDAGRAFMIYIAAVDIPLSVLVPAFAGRKRTNPGKLAKMAAEVIGGVLITCILSGCMDRSIEAVDYLRVVMISETEGGYSTHCYRQSGGSGVSSRIGGAGVSGCCGEPAAGTG